MLLDLLFFVTKFSAISVQSETSEYEFPGAIRDPGPMRDLPAKLNVAPIDVDNMSEVSNFDAELALSLHVQMAAMLAFAYIWSLGSFVPFG